MSDNAITKAEILRLFGELTDHAVLDILGTGADFEALEEAAAWVAREADVMGEERKSLSGTVAQVYEIVMRGEEFSDDERR